MKLDMQANPPCQSALTERESRPAQRWDTFLCL
jgi:hypothetical protein